MTQLVRPSHPLTVTQLAHHNAVLLQEGVRVPLFPYRREWTMSGNDAHVVLKGQEFALDAGDDVFHRRAAEIPAPDRAGKECVARKYRRCAIAVERKTDAAGRVSRRV